jgi:hypothetical protein
MLISEHNGFLSGCIGGLLVRYQGEFPALWRWSICCRIFRVTLDYSVSLLTFQAAKKIKTRRLPSSATCMLHAVFLLWLFFGTDDAGDIFLRNVDLLPSTQRYIRKDTIVHCDKLKPHSLTHGAELFLRSYQLCSHSRTSQSFIQPKSSLPRS